MWSLSAGSRVLHVCRHACTCAKLQSVQIAGVNGILMYVYVAPPTPVGVWLNRRWPSGYGGTFVISC